jgi:hypothetical protein
MRSEIARFRAQQEWTEQAAEQGLSGYAVTSRHAFIEKRMEQGALYLQQLMDAASMKPEKLDLLTIPDQDPGVRPIFGDTY